jgi:hypothetical protein
MPWNPGVTITQRKQEKKKEKRERTNHYQKVNEISLESELIVKALSIKPQYQTSVPNFLNISTFTSSPENSSILTY